MEQLAHPVTLMPDRLHTLPLVYELNGRVSAYPAAARGFGALNCHLFTEGGRAILLDTGYAALQRSLFSQLDGLLPAGTDLAVMVPRTSELTSSGNLAPLVDRFGVETIYAMYTTDVDLVLNDVRPRRLRADDPAGRDVRVQTISPEEPIDLADDGTRRLRVLRPVMRLLSQFWLWDEAARTLFTGEVFGHVWRERPDGPWFVDETDDETTVEDVARFLAGTRYWWLCGADTSQLRQGFIDLFERLPVENVAPTFGCVLRGRSTVERHVELLTEAMRELGERPVEAGVVVEAS